MVPLNQNIFETLYYRYGQRLESYARKFLNDPQSAQDAVHDVFVKFWEKYQGKCSESWVPVLFTMVRNRCIDDIRHLTFKKSLIPPDVRMSRTEESLFNLTLSGDSSPDQGLLMEEMDRSITENIREL